MAEGPTRWWEFYAVRYAMGTVVGAVAFSFLCSQRPETQSFLFGTFTSNAISLETPRLILLGVYGLIYCYIASAPILVFHASRFLLNPDASKKRVSVCSSIYAVFPALCGIVAWWAAFHHKIPGKPLFVFTAFGLGLLLELEAFGVYLSVARNRQFFEFYDQLARRRDSAKGEIVDSYRHLREHGNSFFIVFLEIALAVVLFEALKLAPSSVTGNTETVTTTWLAVLVIWIVPAVFVWLISTLFERRFRDA